MKTIMAFIFVAFLSACASVEGQPSIIDQIRDYTRTACDFLPTAEVVVALLNGDDRVTNAAAIAADICAAVQTRAVPVVDGVVVEGLRL